MNERAYQVTMTERQRVALVHVFGGFEDEEDLEELAIMEAEWRAQRDQEDGL